MIHRQRKTKIIATLGPASSSKKVIEALFRAGADTFRLNMSHGDQADKKTLVRNIRSVERSVQRPIAIMADLQGPKLRIGHFCKGKVKLKKGQKFTLDLNKAEGDETRVYFPHPEIYGVVKKGDCILLDDGRINMAVVAVTKNTIKCHVNRGKKISNHKGVNLPGTVLPLKALTKKDRSDLKFMLDLGVDWIALSFVQRAQDILEAKRIVKGRAGVLAKIEKPAALPALDGILEAADAVMVARGDLGVEARIEEVPTMQKHIIRSARAKGKPVVVATQMLESMIENPTPTRAEVSDVANAIFDGTDAVMLSAESAVGEYPVEAVGIMDKIAREIEEDPTYQDMIRQGFPEPRATTEDSITMAARLSARTLNAAAIVTFTTSGSTALRAARERPLAPILTLTPELHVARKLCMAWGIHTVKTQDVTSFEEMLGKAKRIACRHGLAKRGDHIVITAGVPFGIAGTTNVMHIANIKGDEVKSRRKEVFKKK